MILLNKLYSKDKKPQLRKFDDETNKMLSHKGNYQLDTKDVVLEDLQASENVAYVQDRLCKIMLEEHGIEIPLQDYSGIQEAIRQDWEEVQMCTLDSSIKFNQKATMLRRILQGDIAQYPFDAEKELGKINKEDIPTYDKFKTQTLNRVTDNLIKIILVRLGGYKRRVEFSKKPFVYKIEKYKQWNGVVPIKEREKTYGMDHYGQKPMWQKRLPGFLLPNINKNRYKK